MFLDTIPFETNIATLLGLTLSAIFLVGLRLLPIFLLLPYFTFGQINMGILRLGLTFGISLFFLPILLPVLEGRPSLTSPIGGIPIVIVFVKELFIGLLLAFVLSLPFWIASAVGNLIDTFSGEQMGEMIDPATSESGTPHGIFLSILCMGLFLEAGFFDQMMFVLLLESFSIWPIDVMLPPEPDKLFVVFGKAFAGIIGIATIIAMPFLIGMMLIDIGLGFVSRSVPSISPFFLSMSAKVLLGLFLHVAYHKALDQHFLDLRRIFDQISALG